MNFNRFFQKISIQRLTLLAMLTALCQISRLIFQFLPNVQPVTAILIILTLSLGFSDALIVAVLSILLSNLMLGMGVWTIAQIGAFSVIILMTSLMIKPLFKKIPFFLMVLYAGFCGYAYGLVISAIQAPFFGIQHFGVYYLSGIPFDTLHAAGNAGFYLLLAPVLFPLLNKCKLKYFNAEHLQKHNNRSND